MSNPTFGFSTTAEEVATHHASQIPGKTILITGVSPGGLGLQTALAFAPHKPRLLILAARSKDALSMAKSEIELLVPDVPIRLLRLDLSCIRTVREAVAEFESWEGVQELNILINNAGIMSVPWALNEDGVESQFATNHLGPWYFTNLLLPKIIAAKGRVVFLSSVGHVYAPARIEVWNFKDGTDYDPDVAYGQSKSANALSALYLARRFASKGVTAYSVHPGLVLTNITRDIPVATLQAKGFLDEEGKFTGIIPQKTFSQGAATTIVAALDPNIAARSGAYLADCRLDHKDPVAEQIKDEANAERLWELSEKLVGEKFNV